MAKAKTPHEARKKRHMRIRNKVSGAPERPRLAVFRSLSHIYAQVIDDSVSHTIVAASTLDAELRQPMDGKTKTNMAQMVGNLIAARALGKGVTTVVFDRGGYRYHGRVKALAEAARAAGLIF